MHFFIAFFLSRYYNIFLHLKNCKIKIKNMNIIKKIIKNKMKKVLDLFLNLGYNICVCERVRVNNKNNNMKNKKYVVVSVGGMNSENEKWLCEFSNLDNCFDYINEKVNEGEMYNNDEELDRNNIYWDSKEELDIFINDEWYELYRKDVKLNKDDVIINMWCIGESNIVYEVEYDINKGDVIDGNGEEGCVVGFDNDEVLLWNDGEGWSSKLSDCIK